MIGWELCCPRSVNGAVFFALPRAFWIPAHLFALPRRVDAAVPSPTTTIAVKETRYRLDNLRPRLMLSTRESRRVSSPACSPSRWDEGLAGAVFVMLILQDQNSRRLRARHQPARGCGRDRDTPRSKPTVLMPFALASRQVVHRSAWLAMFRSPCAMWLALERRRGSCRAVVMICSVIAFAAKHRQTRLA